MPNLRCDAVLIQVIVTELNEAGLPIDDHLQPIDRVFLAKETIDAAITRAVAAVEKKLTEERR